MSAGHFVAHLNYAYIQAGWDIHVLNPHPQPSSWRSKCTHLRSFSSSLSSYQAQPHSSPFPNLLRCPYYNLPQWTYPSWGKLFHSQGAPDWIQKHPLKALGAIPPTLFSLKSTLHQWMNLMHPQGVIAHWLLPNGLFALPWKPLIYVHGGDLALLERLPVLIARRWVHKINQSCKGLVFVSTDLKKRFQVLLQEPLKCPTWVYPMGITTPLPIDPPLRADYLKKAQNRMIITSIGRCVPIKGFDLIPQAFQLLPQDCKQDLCWFIAGDGPQRSYLRQQSQACGLSLFDLGEISAHERDTLLSITSLFLFTSRPLSTRQEGSPVSLGEACVAGCPLIATQTGGVYERIHSFSSSSPSPPFLDPPLTQLIPPNSPHDLAQALLNAWSAWKEHKKRHHDWPSLQHRLDRQKVYRSLTWEYQGQFHTQIAATLFPQSQS